MTGIEAGTSLLCYAAAIGSLAVTLGLSIWLAARRIGRVSPRGMMEGG